ncbi:MAG TPA: hydrogenase expression/formation protein HypE [Candidatus Omnitrophota bacterium]|nr:hydrogenase expression/formation protein HypE [Candidatus Omnitrophota bacterium]HPD84919.1 hydrogenase expression/formation protein HypE [Candidatus Omnitrophota bacterium]HRZ03777.1 hydrogenase expression/formation protein HypE [Candidatus Omnitrophota bacterium]
MSAKSPKDFSLSCPVPITRYPNILMAHGGGGKLMHDLIANMFAVVFKNPFLMEGHDSAVLDLSRKKIAMTTDSYVVRPLFFPGGDIGSLAVYGTVNDLAMSGARPLYLSAGFILEEGLGMEMLWRVVQSMGRAAKKAGVQIVTGDTKVVDKGKGDGIFINTSGVGIIEHRQKVSPRSVRPGDCIILSGDIGRHGIAIMAVREGLEFETTIKSDCAPLAHLVGKLLSAGVEIHCLRDLTRGGLASALNEIALQGKVSIELDENMIPVRGDVQGACEILGLDPLYVANEGRFVAFVKEKDAARALKIIKKDSLGTDASIIGKVRKEFPFIVTMKSKIGANRIVDMLTGEQLPRIC